MGVVAKRQCLKGGNNSTSGRGRCFSVGWSRRLLADGDRCPRVAWHPVGPRLFPLEGVYEYGLLEPLHKM